MATVYMMIARKGLSGGLYPEFTDEYIRVYASQELAERAADFFEDHDGWSVWAVEEVEVRVEEPLLATAPDSALYSVWLESDGTTTHCSCDGEDIPDAERESTSFGWTAKGSQLLIKCCARSSEEARTIAWQRATLVIEKGWRSSEVYTDGLDAKYLRG